MVIGNDISQIADLSPTGFGAAFRDWLERNIEPEWRHVSLGATDEDLVPVRREFGRRLGSAGWLSVTWPTSSGGLGLPSERRLIVAEELVRAGAPEPMNANAIGIFAPVVLRFGNDEQRPRLLQPMLSHDKLWCQGFSEPAAGSDLAAISTRGTLTDDGVRITGQKLWTSYAHLADYCYILVRTDRESKRHHGLSMIALPMDQPGVEVRPVRNIVGTDEFCEVFLNDALASRDDILGQPGDGWRMAMFALGQERSVGLAQRSLRLKAEFERLVATCVAEEERKNPNVNDGLFREDLVDAYVHTRVVSATVRQAVRTDGTGGDVSGTLGPVAKLAWSEGHQRQLDLAMRVVGSEAMLEGPMHDWWTSAIAARGETIYAGTSEIQRNVLARGLGLPKSY